MSASTSKSSSLAPEEPTKVHSGPIRSEDVINFYRKGVLAQHDGCYREAFRIYRLVLPALSSHPLIWIRTVEVIMHALYGKTSLNESSTIDSSHIVGEGCSRRVLIPASRITQNLQAFEKEGLTLEFAGQAVLIACNLAAEVDDTALYKHALRLSTFIFMKQGRMASVRFHLEQLEKLATVEKEMALNMICRMELQFACRSIFPEPIISAEIGPSLRDNVLFNTILEQIRLAKYDKAEYLWRTLTTFVPHRNQDIRCLGVYIYAKMGDIEKARDLIFT